jgi:predicted GIY-YIG superfamily endonuclease
MLSIYEGSYFTYIMASRSHTLYTGVTGNLLKRVFSTNGRNTMVSQRSTTAIDWSGSKDTRKSQTQLPAKSN